MKRLIFVCLLLVVSAGTACAGFWDDAEKLVIKGQQVREQVTPDQSDTPAAEPRQDIPAGSDDLHYIQADDYFISNEPLAKRSWIYVTLAKMTTPPTAATKGEGEFFKVTDGNSTWTKHFWRTRIARPDELRLGAVMIMFEGNSQGSVYMAPKAKDGARKYHWFMARITDVSDLYKGYVTVSGGYKVSPKNLRVLLGN